MSTTDIVTPEPAALPAIPTAAAGNSFSVNDIQTPRITLVQGQTDFLTQREYGARSGDVIWHTEKTDLHWLVGGDSDADYFDGFVVDSHKTWARFQDGGMEFPKPGDVFDKDAGDWVVWFYEVAIPSIDPILSGRIMMSRSNLPAAQGINSAYMRESVRTCVPLGNLGPVPIRFKVVEGTSKTGEHRYFKYQCFATPSADVSDDDYEAAKLIQETTRIMAAQRAVENEAPKADTEPSPGF